MLRLGKTIIAKYNKKYDQIMKFALNFLILIISSIWKREKLVYLLLFLLKIGILHFCE